jgi:four helix bundle protein
VVSDQWSVIGDIQKVSIQGYQDLEVWKKAMDLVVACYRTSERFPNSEAYGLVTQLQRAAVSVPANIAEGQGRNHTKEFLNHLSIAYGSLMEIETHLQIAARLDYVEESSLRTLLAQTAEIGRMLNGLMRSLNRRLTTDH